MIGVDEIKRFMELVVLTGYLKDEKPLSLFLVGKPETGKSSLISSMRGYPNTLYFNDLSYKGFIEEVVPLYEKGQKTHILIPDFINVLSHKRASGFFTSFSIFFKIESGRFMSLATFS